MKSEEKYWKIGMDDVIINKCEVIRNCLRRIHEEYDGCEEQLDVNYTKQDSIILNLQRACEAAIDLGMRLVRMKQLGVPQTTREVFDLLARHKVISHDLSQRLQKMVGFRNIAVHNYEKVDLAVVRSILKNNLGDFEEFCVEAAGP